MALTANSRKSILVTGGSSGLGLELVRILLREGYNVVATGRRSPEIDKGAGSFIFYNVDFADLKNSADVFRRIAAMHSFSAIVNNAGVLSPPKFTRTGDGNEYTFQVNFLAHLLLNEIIIGHCSCRRDLRVISITSPVYRIAGIRDFQDMDSSGYTSVKAYSSSKLYLAMLNDILTARHSENIPECISFDPGTFSSGIYRTQKKWFRAIYMIAAPFMRRPLGVAEALLRLIESDAINPGSVYNIAGKITQLPDFEPTIRNLFIGSCYAMLNEYIDGKSILT